MMTLAHFVSWCHREEEGGEGWSHHVEEEGEGEGWYHRVEEEGAGERGGATVRRKRKRGRGVVPPCGGSGRGGEGWCHPVEEE